MRSKVQLGIVAMAVAVAVAVAIARRGQDRREKDLYAVRLGS